MILFHVNLSNMHILHKWTINSCSWCSDGSNITPHKGNVVPVCTMKAYRGSRVIALLIVNLGTKSRWVVNFIPSLPFTGTHWLGDWVGPWAKLDILGGKKKYLAPARILLHHLACSAVCIPSTLLQLQRYTSYWSKCFCDYLTFFGWLGGSDRLQVAQEEAGMQWILSSNFINWTTYYLTHPSRPLEQLLERIPDYLYLKIWIWHSGKVLYCIFVQANNIV